MSHEAPKRPASAANRKRTRTKKESASHDHAGHRGVGLFGQPRGASVGGSRRRRARAPSRVEYQSGHCGSVARICDRGFARPSLARSRDEGRQARLSRGRGLSFVGAALPRDLRFKRRRDEKFAGSGEAHWRRAIDLHQHGGDDCRRPSAASQ